MNNRQQLHKITRKNKKSLRQLKHLNSDYYIKSMNPDKKTTTSSKQYKNNQLNYQSSSNRKLYSTSSSSSQLIRNSRFHSKDIGRQPYEVVGIERTRSSTILNKRKPKILHSQISNKNLQAVYTRIQQVLQAYQTKIHNLEQKNRSLSKQNIRLRALSCNNYC